MLKACLAALALLAPTVAFGQAAPQQRPSGAPPLVQGQQGGRYVIVFGPFVRADTYLLDTQTGRVWQSVSKDGRSIWQEMIFADWQGAPQNHPAASVH